MKIVIRRTFVALLLCALMLPCASVFASQRARERTRPADLLIVGGTIVTMDERRRVIEDGALAVVRGKIVAVGTRREIERRFRVAPRGELINARGRVVMPGLVNGHTHVPMTLFRGLADDLELMEWLTKYIFPAEAKNVTEEFVRAGTQLGLAEMIRGGTTTYCDMYYFEDAIADETARAGVRGVLGETVIDFPVADNKTWAEAMSYTERFIRKWRNHPLITPAIAPHAPYTVSEEHLREAHALAERLDAPIVMHISETRKEVEDITKQKGLPPVEYLERINFLGPRVVAAHTVHLNEREIEILKDRKVGSVHNPESNMKLASGVAPVPRLIAADVAVGLGTDGAASNNDLSMWDAMDFAAKLHKLSTNDPRALSAEETLRLATIGGARALHMEKEIGSLEEGKRADVIVVDVDSLHQTPLFNVFSHLVYATKASDVRTVVIEGRVVMRDRFLLTLNEAEIKRKAGIFRQRIIESLRGASSRPFEESIKRVD